jgi:hypothetical protein
LAKKGNKKVVGFKGGYVVKPAEDENNPFDVEVLDVTGKCAWCDKQKAEEQRIDIPYPIWQDFQFLMGRFPSLEWGAIYNVEPVGDAGCHGKVTDFIIPEQVVTGSEVEFTEEKDLGGNGIVHSHHSMGGFHSHTDDTSARNLYDYSIVLSTKENICTRRMKTPCGGFGYVKCKIVITELPERIALDKIKKKEFKAVTSTNYTGKNLYATGHMRDAYKNGYKFNGEKDVWEESTYRNYKGMYSSWTRGEMAIELAKLKTICEDCLRAAYCKSCMTSEEITWLETQNLPVAVDTRVLTGMEQVEICQACDQQAIENCAECQVFKGLQ